MDINDFLEMMENRKRMAAIQSLTKRKKQATDEKNSEPKLLREKDYFTEDTHD